MKRLVLLFLLAATSLAAQPGVTRRATNVAALLGHPAFFHLHPVVVVGDLKLLDTGELRLTSDESSIRVVFQGNTPEGLAEVRGEFWDLGKFAADDPRLRTYDLKRTFGIDPDAAWPRAGQVTALMASAVTAATPPAAPSIRGIVMFPGRYLDQKVTIIGQFGGRNLLGDLPDAPAQSRYDFVLRSADTAIWVTNLRPKGKDFDLALDSRIDTGRWVEVSGTLQQGRGLQWINATGSTVSLTEAPKDVSDTPLVRVAAAPPPEVIFSAPTAGETDVTTTSSVRLQFSRDMDPATFKGHIRVHYAAADSPAIPFATQYLPGTRVLELKFAAPLERFTAVIVDIDDGVVGSDKQALVPWSLRFDTGS